MNTTERAGETRGEAARPRPARARRPDRPVQQNGCRASTGIDETSLSASFHAASLHKMLSPCPGESGCQRERVQGCAARNCPCAGHGAQNMRAQPGPACTSSIHVMKPVRALARTGEECSSAHVEGRTLRALRSGGGCSGLGLGVTLRKCGPREYLFDSCSGFIKVVQEQERELGAGKSSLSLPLPRRPGPSVWSLRFLLHAILSAPFFLLLIENASVREYFLRQAITLALFLSLSLSLARAHARARALSLAPPPLKQHHYHQAPSVAFYAPPARFPLSRSPSGSCPSPDKQ